METRIVLDFHRPRFLLGLMFSLCLAPASAAVELSIAEFGVAPDSGDNATPAVQQAVARLRNAGGGRLFFPEGRYDFHADGAPRVEYFISNHADGIPKTLAFWLKDLDGVTIEGDGALFVFHHDMTAFAIDGSTDIAVRGVALDWQRPTHSQASLISVARGRRYGKPPGRHTASTVVLRFSDESLYRIDQGRFRFVVDGEAVTDWSSQLHDGETGRILLQTGDRAFGAPLSARAATELEPGLVRFTGTIHPRLEPGDRIVFRHNDRHNPAFFLRQSRDVVLEDVAIHHAGAMGVIAQRTENIRLTRLRVLPREGSGRVFTTVADATHFSGCRGRIAVEDSEFGYMLDDAINVHGTSPRIVGLDDPHTVTVKFMHHQSKGLEIAGPGDVMRVIDHRTLLPRTREAEVASVEVIDGWRQRIRFRNPLPSTVVKKDALENLSWTPEVVFRNNRVFNNRARGMLFNSPRRTLVENNYVRSSGSAVLVAGDANYWFESGAVGEFGPLIIRGNTFHNNLTNRYQFCQAVIAIDPEIPQLAEQAYHRRIEISDNTFQVFDAPILFARSVDGLRFVGNRIEYNEDFPRWHPNRATFTLQGSRAVELDGNRFVGEMAGPRIQIQDMTIEQLRGSDVETP